MQTTAEFYKNFNIAELSLVGVLGVLLHPRNLEVLLTLLQPEGQIMSPTLLLAPPGFENLTTSLLR